MDKIKIADQIIELAMLLKEDEKKYFRFKVLSKSSVEISWNYIGVTDVLFTNEERIENNRPWMSFNDLSKKPIDPDGTVISNLKPDQKFYFSLRGVEVESLEHETEKETDVVIPTSDVECGFWYSEEVPSNLPMKRHCTIGHARSANLKLVQPVIDSGLKAIPSLSVFKPEDSEYELRQKVRWYTSPLNNAGMSNISFINLQDEPTKLTPGQMEVVIDEAKKSYPMVDSTFMFTRGMLLDGIFPKNMALAGCNLYPLFTKEAPSGYVQIWSYEDFKNHADNVFSKVRDQIPGVKLAITAQTFYTKANVDSHPWRKPSAETAEWYMRYIKESGDIKYLLFWEWQNSEKWIGLESMSALQSAWNLQLKK